MRPAGVTALAMFFGIGATISFVSLVSLLFRNSPLDSMWRLNPRAHDAFLRMGPLSLVLLAAVSGACAFTAVGLWKCRRWGYRFAVAMLILNLLGDVANVLLRTEPRALVGVPIAAAILLFLARERTRAFFRVYEIKPGDFP